MGYMDKGLKMFTKALRRLDKMDLPAALDMMLPYAESHPYILYTEELKGIAESYNFMAHYMELGVKDPMREDVYADMVQRMNKVVRNLRSDYRRRNVEFYRDAGSRVSKSMSMSEKAIRMTLEDFVSDVAMLQLESDADRAEAERNLYEKHYSFMRSLFCSIVVSDLWTQDQAEKMTAVLLLPTIDSADAQMIVSALMLATMNSFDINKFAILVEVYRRSSDTRLKQKALVGLALSMTDTVAVAEQKAYIDELCADPLTVHELMDLQKQIVFCMNTERDNAVIQRDIMPTLFKNSNFNVTRLGITEKEDDPMQDILDPGAQDRAMEETEEKFREMLDMQKSGADIYFGGFSQMKRFPFFYTLSNWFTPFNVNHPDITKRIAGFKDSRFLEMLLDSGAFCDSDKYSFALALATVIDRLPPNIMEMMGNADALGIGGPVNNEEASSPAYIRRQTLQDLYRFFRLYQWHEQIYNPFTLENCLFVRSTLFENTPVEAEKVDFARFLIKRHAKDLLGKLVPDIENIHTPEADMLAGVYYLDYASDHEKAAGCFKRVLENAPDDTKANTGLGKALFRLGRFTEAKTVYEVLYAENPNKKSIAFEYAIILTQTASYAEATEILYRLDFQYPDSPNIKRVLAWALMGQKKLEQAAREYVWLLNREKPVSSDFLNAGYSKWFAGNVSEAADMFASYCRQVMTDGTAKPDYPEIASVLGEEFSKDEKMLQNYGLTTVDRMLLQTITYNKISQ